MGFTATCGGTHELESMRSRRQGVAAWGQIIAAAGGETGDFRFKLGDALSKLLDRWRELALGVARRDVLVAVHVPGFDLEDDRPLDFAGILRVAKLVEQFRIVVDNLGRAPELDALAIRVVHQEDKRFGIFRKVAEGDVLSIAAEVGEGERFFVEHFEEAGRAAAMLDVGLGIGAGGAEVEHVHVLDEFGELGRDFGLPAVAFFDVGIGAARALGRLDGFHRG